MTCSVLYLWKLLLVIWYRMQYVLLKEIHNPEPVLLSQLLVFANNGLYVRSTTNHLVLVVVVVWGWGRHLRISQFGSMFFESSSMLCANLNCRQQHFIGTTMDSACCQRTQLEISEWHLPMFWSEPWIDAVLSGRERAQLWRGTIEQLFLACMHACLWPHLLWSLDRQPFPHFSD